MPGMGEPALSPAQVAFCTLSPQLTLLSWISMRTWCCLPLPPWVRQEFWGRLGPEQREGEPLGPMKLPLALERGTGDKLTRGNPLPVREGPSAQGRKASPGEVGGARKEEERSH